MSTGGAVANPDDMERFARELKQFNSLLADSMSRLQGQFANLGETWRDHEHQKFAQEFEQTTSVVHQFRRSSREQIPFLTRKATRIRDYLAKRYCLVERKTVRDASNCETHLYIWRRILYTYRSEAHRENTKKIRGYFAIYRDPSGVTSSCSFDISSQSGSYRERYPGTWAHHTLPTLRLTTPTECF